MNLERLNLRHRRWLVLGLSLLVTAAACAFLFPALIAGTADLIDLTAAGLFVVIMFAGSFNFWLFVFGGTPKTATETVALPKPTLPEADLWGDQAEEASFARNRRKREGLGAVGGCGWKFAQL